MTLHRLTKDGVQYQVLVLPNGAVAKITTITPGKPALELRQVNGMFVGNAFDKALFDGYLHSEMSVKME